jgi:hypothetical protein
LDLDEDLTLKLFILKVLPESHLASMIYTAFRESFSETADRSFDFAALRSGMTPFVGFSVGEPLWQVLSASHLEKRPQRLKPHKATTGCGTAEAVPLSKTQSKG